MTNECLLAALERYRGRLRVSSIAVAALVAAAAAGLVAGIAMIAQWGPVRGRAAAAVTFAVVLLVAAAHAWRRWSWPLVAEAVESRVALDNLVITAEEVASGRSTIRHEAIRNDVFTSAIERLERVAPSRVVPVARVAAAALASIGAVVLLLAVIPAAPAADGIRTDARPALESAPLQTGDLRIVVTAPAYARREPAEFVNPTSVAALEGSTLRLELALGEQPGGVALHELDGGERVFDVAGGRASLELPATSSRPLLIRQRQGEQISDRLVQLRVDADERPSVTIRQPAKDLVFPESTGAVPLQIEARDDVGLQSLALRYTRVSGSGETFTFEEGEWPLEIAREGGSSWRARAVFSLEQLKLQDGDTLVYRALARDAKPGADPSTSDTYLIEVGRLAGVASQGFALPEERDRQAISQQMLIIKTERLHAEKGKLSNEAFVEQSRGLAVEQRMVQAEFVFMTGGHVHDEVAEAEASHEIAEGRQENTAQAELLNAIREMSRAEARLNAGDTAQALEFERAALKALQRAFDRRRYLLRTLPERARIDVTRRLTGELGAAESSAVVTDAVVRDPVVANARGVLTELSSASTGSGSLAALAARLLALDPGSEALQMASLQLTAAIDATARRTASEHAERAVIDLLRRRLASQLPSSLQREPIKGRLVEELKSGGQPR